MNSFFRNTPRYLIVFIFSLFLTSMCIANENSQPPKIGNFALPTSQQPGPMIGLGENILDKHETQLFLFADDYAGVDKHFVDLIPSVTYGITDKLSLSVNAPYAASYKTGMQESSGFEDAFAQMEYVVYDKSTSSYVDQATVLGNVSAPTGSTQKAPATGVGSPSFLLGATFNRTYVNWFVFGSPGAQLNTGDEGTQFGNSYLYQFGFGRNIANVNGWMLAWMTEVNGTYADRNIINGTTDPNSGGNVIYVTPSFWASTKKVIFQLGVGFPVSQNLYGNQTQDSYLLAANIGWSFY